MSTLLKILLAMSIASCAFFADARGGGGGGGGGGGHASGGGGGRSSGSFSSSSASRPAAPAPTVRSTTTTTTSTTRTTGGGYSGRYVGGGAYYGGMGMGYGYSNGLVTGMILGNMMHPHNTVVYTGGGTYNNNALLYPDGRVVSQTGQQVGTYQNGVFTPMVNGPVVAQPLPADVVQQPAQPVVIQEEDSVLKVLGIILLILVAIVLFMLIIGVLA